MSLALVVIATAVATVLNAPLLLGEALTHKHLIATLLFEGLWAMGYWHLRKEGNAIVQGVLKIYMICVFITSIATLVGTVVSAENLLNVMLPSRMVFLSPFYGYLYLINQPVLLYVLVGLSSCGLVILRWRSDTTQDMG